MKKVAFFSGPAWERWDATSPNVKGIGGSETCLVYLSAELRKLGHEVSLFIDTEAKRDVDGVHYYPFRELSELRDKEFDYFIHFRNTKALELKPSAKCHIGFAQDVALSTKEGEANLSGKLDYLVSLSEPHTKHLSAHHSFPIEKILMTANAVDPAKYLAPKEKVRNQIFYSSCPSRDLDQLLWCSQDIAKYVPNFSLVVAYGLQTWEGLLRQGRGDYRKYFFTLDMMKSFPWVKYLGRINQRALAELQSSSRGWFYPTAFPETFCITAAEAGFARCPILASNCFGLETTIKDSGIIVNGSPDSPDFRAAFVENAIRLLTDDVHWREWSERSYDRMRRFTWEAVAQQWHQFFTNGQWRNIQ